LHAMVLSKILAIVKRGETPSSFATAPAEHENTPPMPKPAPVETAAKPEPGIDTAEPAARIASKPLTEEPAKTETSAASAPKAAEPKPAPESTPATPVVSATASPVAPHPVAAPAASAPQPANAPAVAAAPQALPAPERLEYEKLVLPK